MMRLYLVRHGQTDWNEAGRAQGHTDIPLNAKGREQAAAIAEAFQTIAIDRVMSSDLARARQTAEAVAANAGVPLELRRDLRERSFGEWEGSDFTEVSARAIEMSLIQGTSALDVRPPGGESLVDVWDRLDTFMSELEGYSGRLLVVSHGAAGSVLMARLTRGTIATSRSFRFANTAITELERRADGYFSIVRYNDTAHLSVARSAARAADEAAR